MTRRLVFAAAAAVASVVGLSACTSTSDVGNIPLDDELTWTELVDGDRTFRCVYFYIEKEAGNGSTGGPALWCYEPEPALAGEGFAAAPDAASKCFYKLPKGAVYQRPYWVVKGKRVAYARTEDSCPDFGWRA